MGELIDKAIRALVSGKLPDSLKLILLGMLIMAGLWYVNTIRENDLASISTKVSMVQAQVERLSDKMDDATQAGVKRTARYNARLRRLYGVNGWDYEEVEP